MRHSCHLVVAALSLLACTRPGCSPGAKPPRRQQPEAAASKSSTTQPTQAANPQPNILFILVDDLGYGDLGSFWQDRGSRAPKKFDTPAIDRLAAHGVKLTHHYVAAPVCAPARASFLSGRHQGHANVRDSQFDKPLSNNHTVGTVLQQAGYHTAWIGKAGLSGPKDSVPLAGQGSRALVAHPLKRGFDRFFGYHFHQDGHEHYPANGTTNKRALIYDDYQQINQASVDLYTTDAWTAAAKKVIIDEASDGDQQPFFLFVAYDTPHFKMQRPAVAYPPLDQDGDPRTGGVQWTNQRDAFGNVRYASTATGLGRPDSYTHPDIPASWTAAEKQHVGMIRRIDNGVADLMRTLEDLGLVHNTLVVFSSDNGPHNEGNDPRSFESFANMEGIKRDMWEAGIRVPTIASWPGRIQASGTDSGILENAFPSAQWDWLPTFAQAAGVTAPSWADGVSLLPTLTGAQAQQRDKGYLYFEFSVKGTTPSWPQFSNHGGTPRGLMQTIRVGRHTGVRTNVRSGGEPFAIFDVVTDPGQARDLAPLQPALQAQLQALALSARRPGGGTVRPYDSMNLPSVAAPAGLRPGVAYRTYSVALPWVPEYRDMLPALVAADTNINPAKHSPADNSGILYTGFINVPVAGSYTFFLRTDAGGSLHLHDAHVVDDDFHHNGNEVSGSIGLQVGHHPFRLYYRHAAGPHLALLQWSGPGLHKQPIPDASLFFSEALPAAAAAPREYGGHPGGSRHGG
ncbi:MAG: sulfatase-like hydrolase/transferase [Proteobacteria bacterium]|nr:sulfatase-like hydrolase/transferase [Pseudomonadota bacterium]